MFDPDLFREQMKEALDSAELSQAEAARRLHVERQALNNYLRGVYMPKLDFVVAFAELCEVPLEWLVAQRGPRLAEAELRLDEWSVTTLALWEVGADDLLEDKTAAEREHQRDVFVKEFEEKAAYHAWTGMVRVHFHSTLGRWLKTLTDEERVKPTVRADHATRLVKQLLDPFDDGGDRQMELDTRTFTDYATGILHTLALAMPERPSR